MSEFFQTPVTSLPRHTGICFGSSGAQAGTAAGCTRRAIKGSHAGSHRTFHRICVCDHRHRRSAGSGAAASHTLLTLYWSASEETVPASIKSHARRVQSMIRAMAKESGLDWVVIDPQPDSESELRALSEKIHKIPMSSGDNFFLGLTVEQNGRTGRIPYLDIRRESLLEYDLVQALNGLSRIDIQYLRAAQSMGATQWDLFRKIILPGTLPSIFIGAAVGMGITWEVVLAAEMISGGGQQSGGGLGFFIWSSYMGGVMDQVIVGMISIGLAGYISSSGI